MAPSAFYAHTLSGRPKTQWQSLPEHLRGVGDLAARFAAAFDSEEWGRLAGLWHDLGKYQSAFQRRLEGERTDPTFHKVVGALLAHAKSPGKALPLAMAIAGHHGGLPDLEELAGLLKAEKERLSEVAPRIPSEIGDLELPDLPLWLATDRASRRTERDRSRRRIEFWIRFLFSALVDADFLDTEAFMRPDRAVLREKRCVPLSELSARLDRAIEEIAAQAQPTPVNHVREQVLSACLAAAENAPGAFSLTVPTGGGKTLSGMAFALRHAVRNDLKRVIVVIPYTSIIEQNAKIYRQALGDEHVIEHHASLEPEKETQINRLASENWDAPVVVTTTVQFFESLFANRPSRCRKLHNVARSVILLDEVQCLPPDLLQPILDGMTELIGHYGCSVVLSTATPPALTARESMPMGLEDVRPIVPDPHDLARRLSRVRITWPRPDAPPTTWEEIAQVAARHDRCLVVVNRREDARRLARMLPEEGRYHLSALMCPSHRLATLARIAEALASGATCRVVSTQLVEAGVDLDFPVVFRAMAGLDSIVQAAGRCNREGRSDHGDVFVFRPPTSPPRGVLSMAAEETESLLRERGGTLDPSDPHLFDVFFRGLYFRSDTDAWSIQPNRAEFKFRTVAQNFRIIRDGATRSIVVPYADSRDRLDTLRAQGPSRERLRALQRFVVSVYEREFIRLYEAGAIEEIHGVVYALTPAFRHLYDDAYGLVLEGQPGAEPEALIV